MAQPELKDKVYDKTKSQLVSGESDQCVLVRALCCVLRTARLLLQTAEYLPH